MTTPIMKSRIGQTIIDLLPITTENRSWKVLPSGRIRSNFGECPACAVINEIEGTIIETISPHFAIKHIDGEYPDNEIMDDISYIVTAADRKSDDTLRQYFIEVLNPTPL